MPKPSVINSSTHFTNESNQNLEEIPAGAPVFHAVTQGEIGASTEADLPTSDPTRDLFPHPPRRLCLQLQAMRRPPALCMWATQRPRGRTSRACASRHLPRRPRALTGLAPLHPTRCSPRCRICHRRHLADLVRQQDSVRLLQLLLLCLSLCDLKLEHNQKFTSLSSILMEQSGMDVCYY
jgi:hypothetical protein